MNEMVERVARAMMSEGDLFDQAEIDRRWTDYVEPARLAIAAMREPTAAMIEAGWRRDSNISRNVWIDMIDAALK